MSATTIRIRPTAASVAGLRDQAHRCAERAERAAEEGHPVAARDWLQAADAALRAADAARKASTARESRYAMALEAILTVGDLFGEAARAKTIAREALGR